jgi:hypothetical protein
MSGQTPSPFSGTAQSLDAPTGGVPPTATAALATAPAICVPMVLPAVPLSVAGEQVLPVAKSMAPTPPGCSLLATTRADCGGVAARPPLVQDLSRQT